MSADNDASIIRGESVEAGADTYEEVVTGSVSGGVALVEQGVQGQGEAIDQQALNDRQRQVG